MATEADPYTAVNADKDVSLKTNIQDLEQFVTGCKFGMMTTRDAATGSLFSRCMALVATETKGIDLLFFTNTESHKTEELASDPHVNIAFINGSGEWASVAGTTEVVSDRAMVKKHYSPTLRTWIGDRQDGTHDGSENDPRIGIIRVKMTTAAYSLANKSLPGRAVEVVQGIINKTPPHVAKLREITAEDVKLWRQSNLVVEGH